jgi:hypothetical protein
MEVVMKVFAWIFFLVQFANAVLHAVDFAAQGDVAWAVAWTAIATFTIAVWIWVMRVIRREELS